MKIINCYKLCRKLIQIIFLGWHKYIGDNGDIISIEKFGEPAPYQTIFEEYGFNVENVVSKAKALL
jgi:transketolase